MVRATPDVERLMSDRVDIWNNGEYEKIPDVVADSATIYDPGPPDGQVHGHNGLEAFLRELRTGFPISRSRSTICSLTMKEPWSNGR